MIPAVIGALLLAACSSSTETAIAPPTTVSGGGLSGTSSVLPTEASTELSTPLSTEAGTSVGTEASTSVSTEASTAAATSAATEAGTAMASTQTTGQGTAQPGQALLINSTQLIGLQVVDSTGSPVGMVADALVDMSGTVKTVVLNLNSANSAAGTPSANSTSAATSEATSAATSQPLNTTSPNATQSSSASTPGVSGTAAAGETPAVASTAMNAGNFVAVDWSQFQADPTNSRLTFMGSATSLTSGPAFDEQSVCNNVIVPNNGTGGLNSFAGMWRLAAPLTSINLQDASGVSVGTMDNVIIDLNKGLALYAVLNLTNQATPSANATSGAATTPSANSTSASAASTPMASSTSTTACTTTPASSTSTGLTTGTMVVVPFQDVSAQVTAATTSNQGTNPTVMLQVPASKLDSAPNLDTLQLPMWPQMAQAGWNTQINSYWGIAGQ